MVCEDAQPCTSARSQKGLLKCLEASGPSIDENVNAALQRRLQIAREVYNQWTNCGSHEAGLADRFGDGSISALETYIQESSPDLTAVVDTSCQGGAHDIDRLQAHELTYDSFVADYMLPNRPVLIQGTNEGWLATREWVTSDGKINIDLLDKHFRNACISATTSGGEYGAGKRFEMTFHEFAEKWRSGAARAEELYLKDWHFANEFPSYKAYACPRYFTDDWLNDYFDMIRTETAGRSQQDIAVSDYRFVYLGSKGTSTPIHTDVLKSFSWSTNIAGRKRWKLLPPQHTPLLMDRFGRDMAPRFDSEGCEGQFPNLKQACALVIEIEQGTNEALFVPSGWHHSVENMEDTLSINHNWLNAFNIHWSWELLLKEHEDAAKAIEDCRALCNAHEFEDLVQRNMEVNCSFNYIRMAHFVGTVAVRQMQRLANSSKEQSSLEAFSLRRSLLVLEKTTSALASAYQKRDHCCVASGESIARTTPSAEELEALQTRLDGIMHTESSVAQTIEELSRLKQIGSSVLSTCDL